MASRYPKIITIILLSLSLYTCQKNDDNNDGDYKCGDIITDARDGQQYATVCIGNQVWMAENLNWAVAGVCYDDNSNNCNAYGRLYSIEELTNFQTSNTSPSGIQGICPDGWHVPSSAEWDTLVRSVGGFAAANLKLKATTDWPVPGTDDFGFRLLPSGSLLITADSLTYESLGQLTTQWTSTSFNSNTYTFLTISEGSFFGSAFPEGSTSSRKCSCRCVKD